MALPDFLWIFDRAAVLLTSAGDFEIIPLSCEDLSFVPSHGEVNNGQETGTDPIMLGTIDEPE